MPNLYMETTGIPAMKTAGEITALLVQAGARQINQTFDADGKLVGLRFTLPAPGGEATFSLPVRTESVFRHLQLKLNPRNREKNEANHRDQAERVAWRQLLRWIQAQLAFIETGMVQSAEVFMPYAVLPGKDVTMFEAFASSVKLLG